MTLMDEPYAASVPNDLLSRPAKGGRPRVSLVVPVGETSDVTSMIERLPGLDGEVILVAARPAQAEAAAARALRLDVRVARETGDGDGAAVRAGFAAARGDCIVVLDGDGHIDAREIQRFVATLQAGCDSLRIR